MAHNILKNAVPSPLPDVKPVVEVGAATAAALLTSAVIAEQPVADVYFEVKALTAETVQLKGVDVNGTASAALVPLDVTTGNPVASASLGVGKYVLPIRQLGPFLGFTVTKSGAVNQGIVVLTRIYDNKYRGGTF